MPSIYSTILGLISYTPPSFTPLVEPSEGFALRVYMVVGFRHGRALFLWVSRCPLEAAFLFGCYPFGACVHYPKP